MRLGPLPRWRSVALFLLAAVPLVWLKLKTLSMPVEDRLISSDDITRIGAYGRIARMTREEQCALAVGLTQRFASTDARRRRLALYAVRISRCTESSVLAAVEKLLSDGRRGVRDEAIMVLMEAGEPGVERAIALLSSDQPVIRRSAEEIVRHGGLASESLLARELTDARVGHRRLAARLLGVVDFAGGEAVASLKTAIHDSDPDTRMEAAVALEMLRPGTTVTVAGLTEALRVRPWDPRAFRAAKLLGEKGAAAAAALPTVVGVVRTGGDGYGSGPYERPVAAALADRLSPRPSDLDLLRWQVRDKDVAVRYRALFDLSNRVPPDLEHLPLFVLALSDRDVAVQARAFVGLSRLGLDKTERVAADVYPKLISTYARAAPAVDGFDRVAIEALVTLGEPILPTVAAAIRMETLPTPLADRLLDRFGSEANGFLRSSLASPSEKLRRVAALQLAKRKETDADVLKILQQATEGRDSYVAAHAREILAAERSARPEEPLR